MVLSKTRSLGAAQVPARGRRLVDGRDGAARLSERRTCTYFLLFGSSTVWMFGRTPPAAM
eukprot:COSAG04_NODE_17522_length_467_cov_0.695652_1_plen_59_part_10